jgi:hypothetical protein
VYHAAEMVELLRVIELSGALACNTVSNAQTVVANSDKSKREEEDMISRKRQKNEGL